MEKANTHGIGFLFPERSERSPFFRRAIAMRKTHGLPEEGIEVRPSKEGINLKSLSLDIGLYVGGGEI